MVAHKLTFVIIVLPESLISIFLLFIHFFFYKNSVLC